MQRHFSNRGEAHAEAVAAKMRASHKPSEKPISARRRNLPEAWQPQAPAVLPAKSRTRKEADPARTPDFGAPEL